VSLCVAIWESAERYVLAADSRVTRDVCDRADDGVVKATRMGEWLVAWVGGMPAGVRLARELSRSIGVPATTGLDHALMEAALRDAWDATVTACGPTPAGDYPRTGATLLCVGPAGIVEMESSGCLIWEPRRAREPRQYRAVGCAKDYAIGCLDSVDETDPMDEATATAVVNMAARRYPAVGGPVTVLRGPA
jgi:hypothetical protein